jgi:hypothetical protein
MFYGILSSIQSGDIIRVFGPDMQVALYQNLFLLCVLMILTMSGIQKHKEPTLVFSSSADDSDISSVTKTGFADKMKQTMAAAKEKQQTSNPDVALTDMYEPGVISYEVDTKDKEHDIMDNDTELKTDGVDDFTNEPGDELFEDEDQDEIHIPDFATKLIKAQRTQKEIVVNFIKDFMRFIKETEYVYNEMSLQRIAEQKAKTVEKQKRKNLGVFKYLAQEGMNSDYRMIQNMISMGELEYSGLHEFMRSFYGEKYDGGDIDMPDPDRIQPEDYSEAVDDDGDLELGEEQARRNKLGLDDYEMEEMGFVGAAEDMEEMDYGYLGVDEE